MQDPDFISLFVAPLEAAEIRYMITGSVASSIYGEPRNTLDIDLVVMMDAGQMPLFIRSFPESLYYLPPVDVIIIEARREVHGHFNIIHHQSGLKADIYLSRNHSYLSWALAHVRRLRTPTCEISLAPPEYVILRKLEFFRDSGHERHLRDIAGIVEQQELDRGMLDAAIRQLTLESEWNAVSARLRNP